MGTGVMVITTKFDIGDKVIIGGDSSVKATVQRFQINGHGAVLMEVMWFGQYGDIKEHWFYDWQLEKVE